MELKRFNKSYLTKLSKSLQENFNNKEFKINKIKWKYFSTIHNNNSVCFIAVDNNKVVSNYINIPIPITYKNKEYKSMICTDICTNINYRKKGLISKLAKKVYTEVKNKNYDFSIGFSNKYGIILDRKSKNYGYKVVGKFKRYIKIPLLRFNRNISFKKVNNFNANFINQKNISYYTYKKDINYLNWRYKNKPNSKYFIYELFLKNKFIAYVILVNKKYLSYVQDIIVDDKNMIYFKDIIKVIDTIAIKNKKIGVIYFHLNNKLWSDIVKNMGFFEIKKWKTKYYLTIKFHKNLKEEIQLLDENKWFLMSGDIL